MCPVGWREGPGQGLHWGLQGETWTFFSSFLVLGGAHILRCLVLHSNSAIGGSLLGVVLGRWGDYLGWQGFNPGWPSARPALLYAIPPPTSSLKGLKGPGLRLFRPRAGCILALPGHYAKSLQKGGRSEVRPRRRRVCDFPAPVSQMGHWYTNQIL